MNFKIRLSCRGEYRCDNMLPLSLTICRFILVDNGQYYTGEWVSTWLSSVQDDSLSWLIFNASSSVFAFCHKQCYKKVGESALWFPSSDRKSTYIKNNVDCVTFVVNTPLLFHRSTTTISSYIISLIRNFKLTPVYCWWNVHLTVTFCGSLILNTILVKQKLNTYSFP